MDAPARFALLVDFGSLTAIMHRADGPCYPPRRPSWLQRLLAKFERKEPLERRWVGVNTEAEAFALVDELNAMRTIGSILLTPIDEFTKCWCIGVQVADYPPLMLPIKMTTRRRRR